MRYYVVLDTNVLVSALLSKRSVPGKILDEAAGGCIAPLYTDSILEEYEEVLHRDKFPFQETDIRAMIDTIRQRGVSVEPEAVDVDMPDKDDVVFYAVVTEKRKDGEAYLVTGNLKHYPKELFIVTPREMLEIIEKDVQTSPDDPIS